MMHLVFLSLLVSSTSAFSWKERRGTEALPWYAEYCNKEPLKYAPRPLSRTDAALVDSITQLQVFTRHGARVTSKPIATYFPIAQSGPNAQGFECEYNTLTTRVNGDSSREYATLQKHYPANEELVEGNCLSAQSVPDLYMQHKANGRMLNEAYLSDLAPAKMRLFGSAEMRSVVDCMLQATCDWWSRLFDFRSSDMERTLASATALLSNMLAPAMESPKAVSTLTLHLSVNDLHTDPYNPTHDWQCTDLMAYYKAGGKSSAEFQSVWNSEFSRRVRRQWQEEAGSVCDNDLLYGVQPIYCFGLDVPVSEALYSDAMELMYQLQSAQNNNNESTLTSSQLASGPLAHLMLDYLPLNSKKNADLYKFVHHSFHDTSILFLLGALGVFDGVNPVFAEMLALEVYKSSAFASGFAFRFLRNGTPLDGFSKMKGCRPKGLLADSLCDLQLLVYKLTAFAMPIKKWEPHCVNVTNSKGIGSMDKELD